ncbi:BatD family protein [Thermomonas sp. HDW16]|uniref:BatD family protein n=1 Tax=Thermomonas sp. HDW16 TaxID=2714945 RepID=UPI00140D2A3D|nr:BatD family protein [Thermomonas sp. HDW16]QIL19911.1 protein BatD [Thermomonas sp. HDW16]
MFARFLLLLVVFTALPVSAQTRAWLDRAQITYGETATLNIETSASVQSIDYSPLSAQFDIAGQTVRRSFEMVNGQSRAKSLFAVGIRPRGPGVLTVPALRIDNVDTTPMRLTVLPPSVQPAGGDADAFVETVLDAVQPYVQQAVGMVVRLHVAVPLLSGQLDQDDVPGASLQRVGEDIQYQREIGGRRYNVVERRYLLVPERSGALVIPGARFNGQAVGGFFDNIFDDGRKSLSAAAPVKRLQVLAIPASAPQPWLPLHDLKLRYVQSPRAARVGEAVAIELEAIADGASASQLPPLTIPDSTQAQVFADPPQSDEQFIEGRPRTTLRRRIAIVPLKAGALTLQGPRIDWWDAAQGVVRTAMLPSLQLQVAPGSVPATTVDDGAPMSPQVDGADTRASVSTIALGRHAPWLLLVVVLAAAFAWWRWRMPVDAMPVAATQSSPPEVQAASLAAALKQGELAAIAHALCTDAGIRGDDLDTVRTRLDDAAQAEAVERLQSARWGSGDAESALAALRRAFAKGAHWRKPGTKKESLLPPLYPE